MPHQLSYYRVSSYGFTLLSFDSYHPWFNKACSFSFLFSQLVIESKIEALFFFFHTSTIGGYHTISTSYSPRHSKNSKSSIPFSLVLGSIMYQSSQYYVMQPPWLLLKKQEKKKKNSYSSSYTLESSSKIDIYTSLPFNILLYSL